MIKVLFVCLGNICRSPLAEGIFKEKVNKQGLADKIEIDSAGTSGWHIGELPDPRSREVAAKNGFDLNTRGRELKATDLKDFDYIAVMDKNNLKDALMLLDASNQHLAEKVFLMGDYHPAGMAEVPDPFYGGPEGFDKIYDMLDKSTEVFLQSIINEHGLK